VAYALAMQESKASHADGHSRCSPNWARTELDLRARPRPELDCGACTQG